jgi:hypothetical protein
MQMTQKEGTMKHPVVTAFAAAAVFSACGPNPVTNLVGSYTGTANITNERYQRMMPVSATVNIFEAAEGKISIVATGKETMATSMRPLELTCRLTGKPISTGFTIDPGSSCALEGVPSTCNGNPAIASIVTASAARTQLGLTIDVRVQGTGCLEMGSGPEYFNVSAKLTKSP